MLGFSCITSLRLRRLGVIYICFSVCLMSSVILSAQYVCFFTSIFHPDSPFLVYLVYYISSIHS